MPLLKPCSSMIAGILLFPTLLGAAPLTLSTCLEEGKKQYTAQQYPQAQATFEKCLQLDADNVDAHLSLAGVLLTQEKLDDAKIHFETALKNMKRTSPYWSYTYSMLGDIALKQQAQKQALGMYNKSLEYNTANVNSLIGKAVVLETQGDKLGAAQAYRSAVAVEPLNIIARRRLIELEPDYFTDEEILTALKQRHAIAPEVTQLTDEKRHLFTRIHQAEQRHGVDYLKNKYGPQAQKLIVTLNKNTDFSRDLLTLEGFKTLEKNIGQDAIAAFRQLNVPEKDIFELRDKQDQKIFTQDTTLTESGFYVYTQALAGKKEYLLPQEAAPLTPQQKQKVQTRVQNLLKKGYTEISRAELKMLETKTLCSEETLQKSLGVLFMPIAKKQYRYFVRTSGPDAMKTVPYYYVMTARKKRNPQLEVPKNSVIEYYKYYGYTICLSDGNLTLAEN